MKKLVLPLLLLASSSALIAAESKPLFGAADWLPSETDSVGFAGQGGNWYPGANPPAEFWEGTPTTVEVMHRKVVGGKFQPFDTKKSVPGYADAKSKNILWKNSVPGISTSSPIVIGGRVITLHSPHYVICWDSDTGKILWQDELQVMTLPKLSADRKSLEPAPDPEQAKKLQVLFEMAQSVYTIERACLPDLRRAKMIGTEVKPLVPYIQAVIAGLERVKPKVIESFPAAAVSLDKDIADAKQLVERITSAETEMVDVNVGAFPAWFEQKYAVPVNNAWPGYQISDTISTPVSDGKIVGVQFGKGQTAAYDLETGKRLWAFRDPTMRATSVSHAPSPLLWKDLLIFNSGGAPERMPTLLALDKRTGAFRWETKAGEKDCPVGVSHGHHMPHYLARLSNGTTTKAVVVSNGGAVIDAETGLKYIKLLPGTPGGRDLWGAGFVGGFGNLIFKTAAGDAFCPPVDSWELKATGSGTVEYVKRPPLNGYSRGQSPFAISDRIWLVNYRTMQFLMDPHTALIWSSLPDVGRETAGFTSTIAGNRLILTDEEVNPSRRERQDDMNLLKAVTIDVTDPAKPILLSTRNLLGTADYPSNLLDTYFPEIASKVEMKEKLLGAYRGLPPGFGVYMAGVTAHGNRLFILSQSHLYCIGPEALGSPKDDPAVIAAIAAAKDADGLTQYLLAERPRYRRDALLRLAELKLPLNAEAKKQVQDLMIKDPFEEVRAASVLALDVEKDAGAQRFLKAVIGAQKARKLGQEDKLTPSLLLTARELGAAYFQDRLPVALAANKDFVSRQALFLVASNVQLFTQPVIDAAIETLKQPDCLIDRPSQIDVLRQQNLADYLGQASGEDPRTLTILRKSDLTPGQLMPVLCHRLPVEELPSFVDEIVRSGKPLGLWGEFPQSGWISRICHRMGTAKAIPVLEKLKTDKPDLAEKLQGIIKGMTAK